MGRSLRGRRWVPALAALVLALTITGCGSGGGAESAWTVYDCGTVQIGVPTEHLEQLVVEVGPVEEELTSGWTQLLSVYERTSLEDAERDYGSSEGFGYLFGFWSLDQAALEGYLGSDGSGVSIFATDGDLYYAYTFATDVQFYRSDQADFLSGGDEWKRWETLADMGGSVLKDMIERNGLEPYSEKDFLDRPFTYEGEHAYVKYYTYFTFDGDKRMYDQLVLSQPVRQGDGGIWCVERTYDVNGTCYPYFPDSGMAAADYYAQLQAACDAGERTDLLTPLGAAKFFGAEAAMVSDTPVEESFALAEGLNTAYMETNIRIQQLVLDLRFDHEVDPLDLLDCAGTFTADTWGVLGRFMYGSDWWTPLKTGLGEAAVGDRQDLRDANMLHLYGTAHGQFAEAIAGFLAAQRAADPAAFQAALEALPPAERTAVTAALDAPA